MNIILYKLLPTNEFDEMNLLTLVNVVHFFLHKLIYKFIHYNIQLDS